MKGDEKRLIKVVMGLVSIKIQIERNCNLAAVHVTIIRILEGKSLVPGKCRPYAMVNLPRN